jgi:TonB family protein
VQWDGSALSLRWNRAAAAIRTAGGGVVWIDDGGEQRRLILSRDELTEGSIAYWPSSGDVNFRLEVTDGRNTASESVRAVRAPRADIGQPQTRTPESPLPARVDMEVMRRQAKLTELPRALHTILPPLSETTWKALRDEVTVDVRVDLDAAGKIRRVELASKPTGANREWNERALDASRRWAFAPARNGSRKVASSVVLHYHFGNPEMAQARVR